MSEQKIMSQHPVQVAVIPALTRNLVSEMSSPANNTILVVDDDVPILEFVRRVLERRGYRVDTAKDPLAGLELTRRNQYATVITDIMMPEISGLELLGRLQALNSNIPVVLMSGQAELPMTIDAVKKGAFDFLTKPFDPKQLIDAVGRATASFSRILEEKCSVALLEEQVSQSAWDWENIFNTITDGITIHDRDFNILYANKAARRILRLSSFIPGELKCFQRYHGTGAPPQGCPSCKSMINGQPVNFETFEPHLNMFVELRAIPRFNSKNELIGMIHIVRDISARKQVEAELQRMQMAALESARVKSEFLANMSHEIRTPMNGVIGMLDLMLNTGTSQQQREYLSMCRTSAETMLNLLNDILDLSKIESGRLELEQMDFSLRRTLKTAIEPLLLQLRGKGLGFLAKVEPGVEDMLVGDSGRLRQVIMNLVGNAVKFTSNGKTTVTISVAERHNTRIKLRFAVSDTGIGIPANRLETIFEAFRQVDSSTTRKYGGTGLGLSIARRLVEMMGGRIWVESETGRGSTFYFTARFGLPRTGTTMGNDQASGAWTTWYGNDDAEKSSALHQGEGGENELSAGCCHDVADCINKLAKALFLKNDIFIEEYAQKLKDNAAAANLAALADDAFRVQLASRKGDLERAAAAFSLLQVHWTEQQRKGDTAPAAVPSHE